MILTANNFWRKWFSKQRNITSFETDRLQLKLSKMPQVDCPVVHRFTPGLYIREIFMPKGTMIVSKIHKTEHPFVVSKGHAAVWTEKSGVIQIVAPFCGITKPGTRRVLFIHEDCVWTTFHPTKRKSVDKIERDIIQPHSINPQIEETVAMRLQERNL